MQDLDYSVGLSAFKRILRISRVTNPAIVRARIRHLTLKISNLEQAPEKSSIDLHYIKLLQTVLDYFEEHLKNISDTT